MPDYTINSSNTITISTSSSQDVMRTHQRLVHERHRNLIRFETVIQSPHFEVSNVVVTQQAYETAQYNGLGNISVNNGSLYGAELYFEEFEGEKILKIDARTWSGYASISNGMDGTYSRNFILTATSSGAVRTPASVNANEIKNLAAIDFVNYIRRNDDDRLYGMLLDLAADNGLQIPDYILNSPVPSTAVDHRNTDRIIAVLSYLMYPMVRESGSYNVAKNSTSFAELWRIHGALSYRKFIEKTFGKTTGNLLKKVWNFCLIGDDASAHDHYTRKFDGNRFSEALAVYQAFGFDYLYQFIEMVEANYYAAVSDRPSNARLSYVTRSVGVLKLKLADHLKMLSAYYDKHKILEMYIEDSSYLEDTCNMIVTLSAPNFVPESLVAMFGTSYRVPKCKTLEELHNKLSRDLTTIKAEKNNKPIQLRPWEEKLNGRTMDDLKFVVATKTRQLAEWGAELKICIASYDDRAVKNQTLLVGIEKNGVLAYAMELKPLVEKSGNYNYRITYSGEWNDSSPKLPPDLYQPNFVFWEQDREILEKNGYGSGDRAGITQLVEMHNKALPKEEFERVSKVVYDWYKEVKQEASEWLSQENEKLKQESAPTTISSTSITLPQGLNDLVVNVN